MSDELIEALKETSRWRSRNVTYWSGRWEQVSTLIPEFKIDDFRVDKGFPANPYLRAIVRLARTSFEQPMPVGVVSNAYGLVQHREVAERCFDGIRFAGVSTENLRCELGLSDLGEWMNLRIYFPSESGYTPKDGKTLGLRLECFNSVDGSSRLVVLLSWARLVCSNGMIIRESMAELRDIHDKHLDLDKIPEIIFKGLSKVPEEVERLAMWEGTSVDSKALAPWADESVSKAWGKKAACRVFHICTSGHDVEIADPFAPGKATEKPIEPTQKVPGAPDKVQNLYDVSQALSWVATGRNNAEERLEWQYHIPQLIDGLASSLQA